MTDKPIISADSSYTRKTSQSAAQPQEQEMKLTVIFRDDSPLINYGDTPSYRSVQIELTASQIDALALRCKTEEISKCFIEPKEPK